MSDRPSAASPPRARRRIAPLATALVVSAAGILLARCAASSGPTAPPAPALPPAPVVAPASQLGSASLAPAHEQSDMTTPTNYTLDLQSPQTQTLQVTMTVADLDPVADASLDIALPVWRPGRYQVLDPAGTVSAVAATDREGRSLPVEKIDKSTWRVGAQGADEVRFSYRVYADSLNDRTRHVDDTHAFLSPSTVLVYPVSRRHAPVRVRLLMPSSWAVASGLDHDPADPRVLLAPDYDVLVDSPLELGLHDVTTFTVDGVPHEIVVWFAGAAHAPKPVYDAEMFKRDFADIVRVQRDVFGDLPYKRYVYQIHAGPGLSGGTEHLNSTIMQTSRAAFEDPAAYARFLGLVSHEMFHTWNVKRLRPADLKPYDYTHENYTRLLWLVEGATSYYDHLCLVRAGLADAREYIDGLGPMIAAELGRPGWRRQSLEESSFDAWITFNKPTPDAANSTVSFYGKGALICLLIDMEIRVRTDGAASFDDLFRLLYRRFPLDGPGYTAADVLAALREITGSGFEPFFASYIAGTEVPDVEKALRTVGVECRPDADDENALPSLGVALTEREGKVFIAGVVSDSPASHAGLMVNDEVLAMNGRRLRRDELAARLERCAPDDVVPFAVFRRDELRVIDVTLGARRDRAWTARLVDSPTDAQRAAFRSWLGREWPG